MSKQYLVIGLGRFGKSVATTLSSLGMDVLGIDSSVSAVQSIASEITHVVQADAKDEDTLKALGVHNLAIRML